MTNPNEKALAIQQQAQTLKDTMPVHLKMLPEVKKTISLINDISAVLVLLTHDKKDIH